MSTLEALQDMLMKDYQLTREQVAPEIALSSLGVDSLGMIDMMMQIEDRFGIAVPEDRPPVLNTINDLAEYVDVLRSCTASQ